MVQHLSDEFHKVVRERESFLDRALGQLQNQRELSHLQLLHTQVLSSGHGQGDLYIIFDGASEGSSQEALRDRCKPNMNWILFHPRRLPQEPLCVWRITLETGFMAQSPLLSGTRLLPARC